MIQSPPEENITIRRPLLQHPPREEADIYANRYPPLHSMPTETARCTLRRLPPSVMQGVVVVVRNAVPPLKRKHGERQGTTALKEARDNGSQMIRLAPVLSPRRQMRRPKKDEGLQHGRILAGGVRKSLIDVGGRLFQRQQRFSRSAVRWPSPGAAGHRCSAYHRGLFVSLV